VSSPVCAARKVDTSTVSPPTWTWTSPKTAADQKRAPEERLHLFGQRVGRDIEVLGLEAKQQIANGATDNERLEPGLVQGGA
jgi:hypothetical protein